MFAYNCSHFCSNSRNADPFNVRFADGQRKRNLIDDNLDSAAAGPFGPMFGSSPSKLMRFHDALVYRRRLADYYANCPPAFPLLPPQIRRPYDPKLFTSRSPDGNAGTRPPTVGVSVSHGGQQSSTSLLSRAGELPVGAEQPIVAPSMPLLGALFSYLHPSLAAAAATAMAHWYLGAGGPASRPPATPDHVQRGMPGQVPDWAVRLRVEDLLRARSAAAAAAAMTGQTSSSSSDDGPWSRYAPTSSAPPEDTQSRQRSQQSASPDTSTLSDVPFRPYLPDNQRPVLSADSQRRSLGEERAANWEPSDVVSSGSKSPDRDAGSGDSDAQGGTSDGRNSSELVNMERMVHGLKHVQTAAIEELSKVADSY